MPKGKFNTLTSWSFSVYTSWLKCPLSVCFDKIQRVKIVEPDNPVFVKGNLAHKIAENHIGSRAKTLPPLIGAAPSPDRGAKPIKVDLTPVKPIITALRKLAAKVELEWAFDRQWLPVSWKDWDNCWLRMKVDVCAETAEPPTVEIVDWKTGKIHDDHRQQRSLYALGGLQLVQLGKLAGGDPKTELTARHVYLDWPDTKAEEHFTMKNLAPLKREWLARTREMMADTTYTARPGYHCRWCKFNAKTSGGPCKDGV